MATASKRARLANNPFVTQSSTEQVEGSCFVLAEHKERATVAGQRLRELLLTKHVSGQMAADLLCKIAWWHQRSGGCGLDDLALDPDVDSNKRKANRLAETVMMRTYRSPNLYYVSVPCYDKLACKRTAVSIPTKLPHESLWRDFGNAEETSTDDSSQIFGNAYDDHPVVRHAVSQGVPWYRIRPVAVYADGIQYTKRDSLHALYFHDLRSGKKYVFATIRCGLSSTCKHTHKSRRKRMDMHARTMSRQCAQANSALCIVRERLRVTI